MAGNEVDVVTDGFFEQLEYPALEMISGHRRQRIMEVLRQVKDHFLLR
jgi:hypothetical protein